MQPREKNRIAAGLLLLLGIAILAIGVAGGMAPPIITGLGFFVIAWTLF